MTTEKKSTTIDWIIFLVSTALCIALLMMRSPWFWVTLPFIGTYLARALRAI